MWRSVKIATVIAIALVWGGVASTLLRRKGALPYQLARAFDGLGPVFIKLGQFLSVRPDLVGRHGAEIFARLQDRASPLGFREIREVVEAELYAPLEALFADFDREPLASASISQVHRAMLKSGKVVAVKVQRPAARRQIKTDLAPIRAAARLASLIPFISSRIDLVAIAEEIEKSLEAETDFRNEAKVSERFALHFGEEENLVIPVVHWSYSGRRVLTTDFVTGHKISDVRARDAEKYGHLARYGATLFFSQVMVHGLFHADLHPSNIFITTEGRIAYLDFGIWGEVDEVERASIVGVVGAMLCRDRAGAVKGLKALGVRIEAEREASFADAVAKVLDQVVKPTLAETSATRLGKGLLSAAITHGVVFPHKYALLVKALLTVEGSARMLHSDFDMEQAAREFLIATRARSATLGEIAELAWRGVMVTAANGSV